MRDRVGEHPEFSVIGRPMAGYLGAFQTKMPILSYFILIIPQRRLNWTCSIYSELIGFE